MDFGKNFSYVTEDEAWLKKVLIGGLPMLVPCVNIVWSFALLGFFKKLFLNVVAGEERPIPEWDDFGGYIMSGLKSVVVVLGYMVPMIVLFVGAWGMSIILGMLKMGALAIVPALCMYCIALPLSLVLGAIVPAGLMRYWTTDSFGEAYKIGAIIGFVKANLGSYLLTLLIHMVSGFCIIFPYGYFVAWKCFGDIWRSTQEQAPQA